MPMWRNGRRGRLKIYSWQQGAGSSPVIGNLTEWFLIIRFFYFTKFVYNNTEINPNFNSLLYLSKHPRSGL